MNVLNVLFLQVSSGEFYALVCNKLSHRGIFLAFWRHQNNAIHIKQRKLIKKYFLNGIYQGKRLEDIYKYNETKCFIVCRNIAGGQHR